MAKKQRKFIDKLKNKYRLVVMQDDTFEEKASFKLSRINVILLLSALFVLFTAMIFALIVFTKLKEYIPGYGDVTLRQDYIELSARTDSIQHALNIREMYWTSIGNVLSGQSDTSAILPINDSVNANYDSIKTDFVSVDDSVLRAEYTPEGINLKAPTVISNNNSFISSDIKDIYFFTPIDGFVTAEFDVKTEHLGIDLGAPENEPIKATLDGVVVVADYTVETGHTIGIQHDNNLVSFYKHNSVLLKKVGNFVKAGEVIAIIGSSGELTTGPHLHFELWHNGVPLNPRDYVIF